MGGETPQSCLVETSTPLAASKRVGRREQNEGPVGGGILEGGPPGRRPLSPPSR